MIDVWYEQLLLELFVGDGFVIETQTSNIIKREPYLKLYEQNRSGMVIGSAIIALRAHVSSKMTMAGMVTD